MTATFDTAAAPPAAPRPVRPLYWSIRREIWEHRALAIVPLAAAGVVMSGFLLSTIGMPHRRLHTLTLPAANQAAVIGEPYIEGAAMILVAMVLVALFYSLNAIQGERRDRSLLFWRSLPVSDATTVLAKAAIPLLVMPLAVLPLVGVTLLAMHLWSTALLLANGVSPAIPSPSLAGPVEVIYGAVVLSLWMAPTYAFLLLVSSWARRGSFLWAALIPLALCLVERLAFGTTHLLMLLKDRFAGAYPAAFVVPTAAQMKASGGIPAVAFADMEPLRFLSNPAVWIGLAFAAACLAGAIRLRRRREPA